MNCDRKIMLQKLKLQNNKTNETTILYAYELERDKTFAELLKRIVRHLHFQS